MPWKSAAGETKKCPIVTQDVLRAWTQEEVQAIQIPIDDDADPYDLSQELVCNYD